MGQTDESIGPNFVDVRFSVPDAGIINATLELRALANLQTTAEEGGAITVAPAAFGPTCKHHETLSEALIYQVEITGGLKLLDVAQNWFLGSPSIVVASQPSDNICPP